MSNEIIQIDEPVLPVSVDIHLSKNAVGAELHPQQFMFVLYNEQHMVIESARNDQSGLINFHVTFNEPGIYNYSVREAEAPGGWERDETEYPIIFNVAQNALLPQLEVVGISYPDGLPGFVNTLRGQNCALIEFPEITFDEPGVYEFILREIGGAGSGWTTDPASIRVIVRVIDDGFGHLIATLEYPDGFPEFTNRYVAESVSIIISACKIAIGAPLPPGRFEFGLYDSEGTLIATARNE